MSDFSDDELMRYSRHILLDGFDIEAQSALKQSSALIIGAGGLGCPAAMYLASAGIGQLHISDDDVVELSNLQRQIAHGTDDVSLSKVASLAQTLAALNPHVDVVQHSSRLDESALNALLEAVDVVLDCSDNFDTRFLLNRVCFASKVPLVSGAAIRMEAQLSVFDARVPQSPCYRCLYAENSSELNCAQSGVLAPVVGVVGSLQALEAVKVLTQVGQPLIGKLLSVDFKSGDFRQFRLAKDAACPVCSDS